MKTKIHFLLFTALLAIGVSAQPVTGVWRGKIKAQGKRNLQLELKLIRNADSLTGTSYYYSSETQYARYLVKGYIDHSGDIIWWDDQLIEKSGSENFSMDHISLHFVTDFNCPGADIMKLDGTAEDHRDADRKTMEVHLDKMKYPIFPDEWDDVIENFPYYAGDPGLIDSIAQSSLTHSDAPIPAEPFPPKVKEKRKPSNSVAGRENPETAKPVLIPAAVAIVPKTVEEKYSERKKIFTREIPLSGDSISLNFYDNAEIDGDSIALFLNGKMKFQHILLKAEPFVFKLAISELAADNELTMVAENLGSIPPNTSLMIAWCNGQRYEVWLASTENSSAMIRFVKPPEQSGAKR